MLNWVNSDWNALLKWAECVLPSGSSVWLWSFSPVGPNNVGISSESLPEASWAETTGASRPRPTIIHAPLRNITRPSFAGVAGAIGPRASQPTYTRDRQNVGWRL